MSDRLTVATRPTALALAQTRIVVSRLKQTDPGLDIQIKKITSAGDKDKRTALFQLKQTGFFTSQLEDALLESKAGLAVHSFKDLPTKTRPGLTIAAVLDRKFPEDCLIAAENITSIEQLPHNAKVGTSSLRRAAQIKHIRPDLQILPLRGSVTTRIKKLDLGQFDAVILARAGLERLVLADRISFVFDPAEFIPAPAQGALAVQIRTDDKKTAQLIKTLDDQSAGTTCLAERLILGKTSAGCHAPLGAYAKITADKITIDAFISNTDGTNFIKRSVTGLVTQSPSLACRLAEELLDAGANDILENIE